MNNKIKEGKEKVLELVKEELDSLCYEHDDLEEVFIDVDITVNSYGPDISKRRRSNCHKNIKLVEPKNHVADEKAGPFTA